MPGPSSWPGATWTASRRVPSGNTVSDGDDVTEHEIRVRAATFLDARGGQAPALPWYAVIGGHLAPHLREPPQPGHEEAKGHGPRMGLEPVADRATTSLGDAAARQAW